MDYIAFCRNYFDVTKIPVSLLKSGYVAYSSFLPISNTGGLPWKIRTMR